MTIITRFAPSPTGYLHIGGARTALFNYLYAKRNEGKFYLRIEDTDRARSTQSAVDAIFKSLQWLGIQWDGEVVHQFQRAARHAEVAKQLVTEGKAYYCYCSVEELDKMREESQSKGLPPRYNGYWRDRDPSEAPKDRLPVIRLKALQTGETEINDQVQGLVRIQNQQLDDMILLRADGTPTYMLSVVVDDHDMNITHIIRGDDHLNNAFRQYHLYKACGWDVPIFAHIPLIHGPDGAKLSKRHGAVGAEAYQERGFLPMAMRNYLLRLGWAHGDNEIISDDQAIEWFNLENIGRSPSRFDVDKLSHLNAHYMRQINESELFDQTLPFLEPLLSDPLTEMQKTWILKGMGGLKIRSKTLIELADSMLVYIKPPLYDEASLEVLKTPQAKDMLLPLQAALKDLKDWSETGIDAYLRDFSKTLGIKFGDLAKVLRVCLTHRMVSPSLFEIMSIIGAEETLKRLDESLQETG